MNQQHLTKFGRKGPLAARQDFYHGLFAPSKLAGGALARRIAMVLLATLSLFAAAPGPAAAQDPPAQLIAHLASHGGDFSVATYGLDPEGRVDSTSAFFHNADQPRSLASTIKILALAVYGREVAAGRQALDEPISFAQWESFYIPFADGGAHPKALTNLGVEFDAFGFASDPDGTVPIDAIVAQMIEVSDNAAFDLLLQRYGLGAFLEVAEGLGLTDQDPPIFISGTVLSFLNHEQSIRTLEEAQELIREGRSAFRRRAEEMTQRYQEPLWRQQFLSWLASDPELPEDEVESLLVRELTPRGTARDYARLMMMTLDGAALSPAVSAIMVRHLDVLSRVEGSVPFEILGFKGGNQKGVRTFAFHMVPTVGPWAGEKRVSVLFLADLPTELDNLLGETSADFNLALTLGFDPSSHDLLSEIACIGDETTLCLNQGRFRARVRFVAPGEEEALARVAPLRSADAGGFIFFSQDNWEVMLKVLDGCGVNRRYWVFGAALTNVAYELEVEDMVSGERWVRSHAGGALSPTYADTTAFSSCP